MIIGSMATDPSMLLVVIVCTTMVLVCRAEGDTHGLQGSPSSHDKLPCHWLSQYLGPKASNWCGGNV